MRIELPDGWVVDRPELGAEGVTLTLVQAEALSRRLVELRPEVHWHMNDCGCCLTIHGHRCAYVIGPDGGEDFFPNRGCDCPSHDGKESNETGDNPED